MAKPKGGSSGVKQGKKPHRNKPTSKRYKYYEIASESIKRKLKFCPRCGSGIFLASHKNRLYCGKCHYTEFLENKIDSK